MAYTLSKGVGMEKMWHDACINEQQREWIHGVDMTFISFIMSSSHFLYDESTMKQQTVLLLGLYLREKGNIFSHMLYDVAGVGDGTIMVQRGYSFVSGNNSLEVLGSKTSTDQGMLFKKDSHNQTCMLKTR